MNERPIERTLQQWINGAWVDASGGETFEVLNPLDDSLYCRAAKGGAADVCDAVAAAKAAFPVYKETTPTERGRWLLRVAELMVSDRRLDDAREARAHDVGFVEPVVRILVEDRRVAFGCDAGLRTESVQLAGERAHPKSRTVRGRVRRRGRGRRWRDPILHDDT